MCLVWSWLASGTRWADLDTNVLNRVIKGRQESARCTLPTSLSRSEEIPSLMAPPKVPNGAVIPRAPIVGVMEKVWNGPEQLSLEFDLD